MNRSPGSPDRAAGSFDHLKHRYLQWMAMRNSTARTLDHWRRILDHFTGWCDQRGIERPADVTAGHIAAYRRYLFHYRNRRTGKPLKFATQAAYLTPVRRWFAWMVREKILADDAAAAVELPKAEQRLPAAILSADEVERIMDAVDVSAPLGVRDRAVLETFYSTAMRRAELVRLEIYDLDRDRRVLTIRQGKGRKDRVVPIGRRALAWIDRYLERVRPRLVLSTGETALFVSCNGRPLGGTHVSLLVKQYFRRAGIDKPGACHVLRHTAATLMMEAGADLRSLQMLLGHERLTTTQIYTHVSIKRLQEVHERTHPAAGGRSVSEGQSEGAERPEPGAAGPQEQAGNGCNR